MPSSSIPHEVTQKLAYETLANYFEEHKNEVIEIEILPPAFQPSDGIMMQDGLNIGIPKTILVTAFLEAQQRFFNDMHNDGDPIAVCRTTKVILLFDPEHITAANHRKRKLETLKSGAFLETGSAYHQALRQELCFLNSILTSPLHRQSKSPTLWFQRLLILEPLARIELEDASEKEKEAFWRAELTAVCRSGERHPKNYHAWQYARRLVSRFGSSDTCGDIGHVVKDWCCRHPSDISGWSFLLHVMPAMRPSVKHSLLRDVIRYAIDLKGEQESLWVFIRVALTHDSFAGPRVELYQALERYYKKIMTPEEESALTTRVKNALRWVDEYQQSAANSAPIWTNWSPG